MSVTQRLPRLKGHGTVIRFPHSRDGHLRKTCGITRERTLPVLEAAHIKPYSEGGVHDLPNGLLLRSDLHKLFDLGYLGIDPDERRVFVSERIREEFQNGKEYHSLHGKQLSAPIEASAWSSRRI
jgi:putative restriction endonuclease